MHEMRTSIFEPAISAWVAEARDLVVQMREAEAAASTAEQRLVQSREQAHLRRYELGTFLLKVRDLMPKRGTKETGWKAFLEAIEVDDSTAHRYMELARGATSQEALLRCNDTEVRESPRLPDVPAPRDEDAPREADAGATDDDVEIDRDTWCTPHWITEAIGQWDLDPCANERSHVKAKNSFDLDRNGEDGLELASSVKKKARVFINPPYSDVMPWIAAYKHTRFCFLLKVDPSTKWFEALLAITELVLIPRRTRVQFEAPPGVPPEKALANQFPHALFYANADDATQAVKALCYPGWFITKQ
jgi:hypothetical protein